MKVPLIPPRSFETYEAYLSATGPGLPLRAWAPETIREEVERAGLRGRGGRGGFAAAKWKALVSASGPPRTAICNAVEGEPGSFKDRLLLRKNPYAPLEGLALAGRAVGADRLLVALKTDSFREIERVRRAAEEMERSGCFEACPVRIVRTEDDYLLGEERALAHAVEKHYTGSEEELLPCSPGAYTPDRPPRGTLVQNAETLARIAQIVRAGAPAFRVEGTSGTPGRLLLTVSGDVRRPGVYEGPAGVSLRRVLFDWAGGPREGRTVKAVLPGFGNAILSGELLDLPVDFESFAGAGSGLGPAALIVLDDLASAPRVAQTVSRFLYVESCRQCKGCNHGLRSAWESFERLLGKEEPREADLDELASLLRALPRASRCPLPEHAARILPSLLERFRREFVAREAAPPYPVPKIDDFDEEKGRFSYDPMQSYKQPDRTYIVAPR